MKKTFYLVLFILISCQTTMAQVANIRVNQQGYYNEGPKVAIVPTEKATTFELLDKSGKSVFKGKLSEASLWEYSNEKVKSADFSSFNKSGIYAIKIEGFDNSPKFAISPKVNEGLLVDALRAFYYGRSSTAIPEEFGGIYKRSAGHPDTKVMVHESAASEKRPAGTIISSPKGWYDAGDYGKYIVNSGISTYTILSTYEHFSNYMNAIGTKIPESKNELPDVLDEALWNLDWMLTMQDPNDGGVYHKLTTKNFTGMVMPSQTNDQRYVVTKSTAAALDFAAVMAQASRIFKEFESVKPGYSKTCLDAAKAAYAWAEKNPAIYFNNPAGVVTGQYEDNNVSDEWTWAATELFITTKEQQFYDKNFISSPIYTSTWQSVSGLTWISLLHNLDVLSADDQEIVKKNILVEADKLYALYNKGGYKMSLTSFNWGSNSNVANEGIMMMQAYHLTKDKKYLTASVSNLDYLLGKNPLDYCYVTGYGTKPVMNIHHRPSAGDDIKNPVPGWLSGGPNSAQQDKCDGYPSNLHALSFVDATCSYASNEIAINWNSPLVYLIASIEVAYQNEDEKLLPIINQQPKGFDGGLNENVIFDVKSLGTFDVKYQWYKNNQALEGEIKPQLIIESTSLATAGDYFVIVSYEGFNDTSDVVKLEISDDDRLQVVVHPNPSIDIFNLSSTREIDVNVFDIKGNKVYSINQTKQVSFGDYLPKGEYFIFAKAYGSSKSFMIMKEN